MYKYYLYIYYNMPKQTYKGGQKPLRKKKAKSTDGRQNQRLAKLEQLVLPSIEYKSRDILTVPASVSSGGYSNQPMLQIEQGTGSEQRIGDKVTLMSHNLSMTIARADGVGADSTNVLRILFIATPSTTALTINDVLEYGNYQSHGDLVFCSPYKKKAVTAENTYRVLFDKVYNIRSNQRLQTDRFQLIPNKKGMQVQFQSTGSVMPENYQLQVLAISDSTASPHPAISYVCRNRFIDL